MNEPIVPFDLVRMFLGTDPPLFYLEIVFRTLVVYIYALAMIRWVGGRGIAQMSTVEFLLVIALGSAVGDVMFYPEVPILHAMLVITVVILINKGLDTLIFRYRSLEKAVDGLTAEVIRDGVIIPETLRDRKMGRSEVFEGLRAQGYRNLGEIRRAYLETSGNFSVFPSPGSTYGLPIEPAWAVEPPPMIGPNATIDGGARPACCECGKLVGPETRVTPSACPNCGSTSWTPARRVNEAPPDRKSLPT
ncbi:DUF421 domain-containing protein [Pseudohoeflea coraliihabitans]|uniref:DUF421 domain-containing protein n=1 Tax=Pseudohoeflea coraliihabitans TaxID=2860393 RepID=A0ABS6WIY8_9HYPH|nr:YetF domain-containing protein [Pseudohoeflea sp. DP4N28-3]MBW3095908.1 DUF421 domain-containing protein [Pseudohoeflea sp. DP4N28-3]